VNVTTTVRERMVNLQDDQGDVKGPK
jgi:hypothetical protein